jgi:hypothetical protein
MADILVKLSDQKPQQNQGDNLPNPPEQEPVTLKFKLNARRTLDGNIIISDHPEIDIVIMPEKMKVLTFSKENFDDTVYETQNRLMKFLFKKGVIVYDSICGGNVYGSLEAKIQQPSKKYPIDDILLMVLAKFIEEEKPSFIYKKSVEDSYIDNLTSPDDETSTDLGEVPAAQEKGSVPIHQVRRYAYGL